MAQSSGVSGAASTDIFRPLMFRFGMVSSPPRCMMPLTAAAHFVKWPGTHRDDADLGGKFDRVPIWKQCNLKLVEGKNCEMQFVRCGNNAAIKPALNWVPTREVSLRRRLDVGQLPSGVGSR